MHLTIGLCFSLIAVLSSVAYIYLKHIRADSKKRAAVNAATTLFIGLALISFLPSQIFEPWYGKVIIFAGLLFAIFLSFYTIYFDRSSL